MVGSQVQKSPESHFFSMNFFWDRKPHGFSSHLVRHTPRCIMAFYSYYLCDISIRFLWDFIQQSNHQQTVDIHLKNDMEFERLYFPQSLRCLSPLNIIQKRSIASPFQDEVLKTHLLKIGHSLQTLFQHKDLHFQPWIQFSAPFFSGLNSSGISWFRLVEASSS